MNSNSQKPIRVGVVGLGRFGRLHADILADLPGVELAALCDSRQETLAELPEAWQEALITTDYAHCLDDARLDAIHIVTPDDLHVEMIRQALARGLAVFVEKPLATTYADAQAVVEEARAAGVLLQVGFVLRYEPRHAYLKEQIEAGVLGRLASLRLKRHAPQSWFHTYGHTIHPMLESTIHDIDLCVWYVDQPCRQVYAVDRSFLGADGPDTSIALLEFAEGTVAMVDASWLVPAGAPWSTVELGGTIDADLEIMGTRGTARLDFLEAGFSVWTEEGAAYPEVSAWPRIMGVTQGALRAELADFVASVRTGQPSSIASVEDAVAGLAIVEAIQRSVQEGRPVTVTGA